MTAYEVPFFSFETIQSQSGAAVDAAIRRVTESSTFILGPEVRRFEEEWADYCGADHCVGLSSGLAALQLALRGAGVSQGDEVIVPAQTFIATWLAASEIGATPVAAEVRKTDCLVSARQVRESMSPRTRAIVPVYLFGQLSDPEIAKLGHGPVSVVSDAAQAHGVARYDSASQCAPLAMTFSFYPTKNLGAMGDAGCIITQDEALAEEVRLLRNYGSMRKYVHIRQGSNLRLDEIQAAILRARLPFLDEWNESRRNAASEYLRALKGLPLELPSVESLDTSSWHLFVVRTRNRDELRRWLEERGVESAIHYPTIPSDQVAYQHPIRSGSVAREWASESVSLPMWPGISTSALKVVAGHIASFFDRNPRAAECAATSQGTS